jgi:hypothetical protein
MKANVLLVLSTLCAGALFASPAETAPADPQPKEDLGEAKMVKPVEMKKALPREGNWTQARHGVIGQFVEAPFVLDPVNPFASPKLGFGQPNLSKDTLTGRVMGLRLIKFEF